MLLSLSLLIIPISLYAAETPQAPALEWIKQPDGTEVCKQYPSYKRNPNRAIVDLTTLIVACAYDEKNNINFRLQESFFDKYKKSQPRKLSIWTLELRSERFSEKDLQQIKQTCANYNIRNLNLVAHSEHGVPANIKEILAGSEFESEATIGGFEDETTLCDETLDHLWGVGDSTH
jgi:hypothetical protein